MNVNIYLETDVKSTKASNGWCGYVIEAMRQQELVTAHGFEYEENRTYNQMTLCALYYALQRFERPGTITIHTDNLHIANCIDAGWPDKWRANGWRNLSGKEIKNCLLWQLGTDGMWGHSVKAVYTKHHAYKPWMQREIECRKKGNANAG